MSHSDAEGMRKQTTIRGIDPKLHHIIRVISVQDRETMGDKINTILAEWILAHHHAVVGAREVAEAYLGRTYTEPEPERDD